MHKLSLLLSITAVCCLNGIQAQQPTYPQWWLDQGIVTAQPPVAPGEPGHDPATWDAWMNDNFAPANVGQAKNLAKAARDTMEDAQAGSAGTAIANMIAGFSTAPEDNYVPLNLGQLKALAAPFYDTLGANSSFAIILGDGTVIPNGSYPWNPATPIADNYAPANLGQLKHVFSFDLSRLHENLDTLSGLIINISSKHGYSIDYDGVDDSIQIPHSTNLDITGELTILAWVKVAAGNYSPNYWPRIVSTKPHWTDIGGYELEYNPAIHRLAFGGKGSEQFVAYDVDLGQEEWHHLAFTLKNIRGTDKYNPKLYVDGRLVVDDYDGVQDLGVSIGVDGDGLVYRSSGFWMSQLN